ncbi:hypothetical protein Hsc_0793 [Herbaspirillum seropedicae]|nr:hypothetical protein Hsc_0793 [Herbaspirillum seropedicae]
MKSPSASIRPRGKLRQARPASVCSERKGGHAQVSDAMGEHLVRWCRFVRTQCRMSGHQATSSTSVTCAVMVRQGHALDRRLFCRRPRWGWTIVSPDG